MADKVERTVIEYAWLCIKRAHVQRSLIGRSGRSSASGQRGAQADITWFDAVPGSYSGSQLSGAITARVRHGDGLLRLWPACHDAVVGAAGPGAAGAGAVAAQHLRGGPPFSSIRSPSAPPRSSQVWLK